MHKISFLRVLALSAAVFCLCAVNDTASAAAALNTADFIAACSADENVTGDPGFEEVKVTPKAYCECVAGEFAKNKLSQADVDMLTKMHKDDISDEDAENYPTLEDLMNANESYEDSCKASLGLPVEEEDDLEEMPMEEDMFPPGEEEAPAEDNGSPPE